MEFNDNIFGISDREIAKKKREGVFFLLFFFSQLEKSKKHFPHKQKKKKKLFLRAHTRTRTFATGVKLKKDSAGGKKRFEYYFLIREIRGWISKKRVRGFHAHVLDKKREREGAPHRRRRVERERET